MTLLVCLFAFLLGMYARTILASLETLAEYWASPLPDTSVLPILECEPYMPMCGHLPVSQWAIAGEYLVRDNGVMRNQHLTRYARWLMGVNADVILLTPAISISASVASTPSGGKYHRRKTERVYRTALTVGGY